MHMWTIDSLVFFALAASLAQGQSPFGTSPNKPSVKKEAPKELSLEAMLARALKANPDLRVAEAKVREAEAELNRTRLLVMQKVAKLNAEIMAAKFLLQEVQARLERAKKVHDRKLISEEEFREKEMGLEKVKADLAKLEAELPYLLGNSPRETKLVYRNGGEGIFVDVTAMAGLKGTGWSGGVVVLDYDNDGWADLILTNPLGSQLYRNNGDGTFTDVTRKVLGKTAGATPVSDTLGERIRRAMAKPVTVEFNDALPKDILDRLWEKARVDGVNIILMVDRGREAHYPKSATVSLGQPVPLSAALQWFEDRFVCRIVIRDYGLVVVEPIGLPPGAVYLQDFLKSPKGSSK